MDALTRTVAENVRRLREQHRLSLSEMSQRSGVGKSTLSQIESGTTNPTLGTLDSLAKAFAVDIRDLVSPPGESREVVVVRRGGGTDISSEAARGELVRSVVAGPSIVEFHRLELSAGAHESSASHGVGAREHVLVIEGRLAVGPEGSSVVLEAGDYCSYPADRVHRWSNESDAPARYWIIATYPRSLSG